MLLWWAASEFLEYDVTFLEMLFVSSMLLLRQYAQVFLNRQRCVQLSSSVFPESPNHFALLEEIGHVCKDGIIVFWKIYNVSVHCVIQVSKVVS